MDNDNEIIVQNAIGYNFKSMVRVVFLEEITKELKLEVNKYWMRPSTEEDWFSHGDWVILEQEPNPILLDEYELTYDILYTKDTEAKVKFAEFLIDSYLEYIGYLEGCLKVEDNKKGDTS